MSIIEQSDDQLLETAAWPVLDEMKTDISKLDVSIADLKGGPQKTVKVAKVNSIQNAALLDRRWDIAGKVSLGVSAASFLTATYLWFGPSAKKFKEAQAAANNADRENAERLFNQSTNYNKYIYALDALGGVSAAISLNSYLRKRKRSRKGL